MDRMMHLLNQFDLAGEPVSCAPLGNGHINSTFLVETDAGGKYVLQRINRRVFPDVEGLMRNIAAVTSHLSRKDPDPRHVMRLVATKEGKWYTVEPSQECWRVYHYIAGGLCLDLPESEEDMRQAGVAFGTFQNQLADFPAETLSETIPRFHDTPSRYRQFRQALREDRAGRLEKCRQEAEWYLLREKDADGLLSLLRAGDLPLRVTHNDTKLNNVLLDRETRKPLCVLDLDTVMPGLAACDFGDAIRSGAATAQEDEPDTSLVHFDLRMYQAFAEGFLSACGARLSSLERQTLPLGARLMTLECGVRFLADYLNGDVYFHCDRGEHNLQRARTQMKLVQEMEEKQEKMERIAALC